MRVAAIQYLKITRRLSDAPDYRRSAVLLVRPRFTPTCGKLLSRVPHRTLFLQACFAAQLQEKSAAARYERFILYEIRRAKSIMHIQTAKDDFSPEVRLSLMRFFHSFYAMMISERRYERIPHIPANFLRHCRLKVFAAIHI